MANTGNMYFLLLFYGQYQTCLRVLIDKLSYICELSYICINKKKAPGFDNNQFSSQKFNWSILGTGQ